MSCSEQNITDTQSDRMYIKWLIYKHNIHKGVQENDVSVKMCMCTVLLLTMVQVMYLLEVFILAHYYGPPNTETRTTETTIARCHKNS